MWFFLVFMVEIGGYKWDYWKCLFGRVLKRFKEEGGMVIVFLGFWIIVFIIISWFFVLLVFFIWNG